MNAPWYEVAEAYIGTKEVPGKGSNPTIWSWIKEFGKNLGAWALRQDDSKIAWCAVFVSACLDRAGLVGTNHALARSYLTYGKPCKATKGAIIVIKRKAVDGEDVRTGSSSGWHVGFLVKMQKHYFVILGGNQSNEVRVSYFPKSRYELKALRWPKADVSTPEPAPDTEPEETPSAPPVPVPPPPRTAPQTWWQRLLSLFRS